MKKFYESYAGDDELFLLLTKVTWSNHLHILSKTKDINEKKFYLNLAAQNNYSERAFSRVIDSAVYERTMLANKKLSAVLTEFPVETKNIFKDSYLFEFTGLTERSDYNEYDLKRSLMKNLKHFLFEMGADFNFVGEEYIVQVGNKD